MTKIVESLAKEKSTHIWWKFQNCKSTKHTYCRRHEKRVTFYLISSKINITWLQNRQLLSLEPTMECHSLMDEVKKVTNAKIMRQMRTFTFFISAQIQIIFFAVVKIWIFIEFGSWYIYIHPSTIFHSDGILLGRKNAWFFLFSQLIWIVTHIMYSIAWLNRQLDQFNLLWWLTAAVS